VNFVFDQENVSNCFTIGGVVESQETQKESQLFSSRITKTCFIKHVG